MPKKPQKEYPESKKILCVRLNELKDKNLFSLSTISKKLGISEYRTASYFRGESKPDWETIVKLARMFDVTTDYLLGTSNVQEPSPSLECTCQYLGLSKKAVENIRFATSESPNSANLLFSYPDMVVALMDLSEALSIQTTPLDNIGVIELEVEANNKGFELITLSNYRRHLIRDVFEDWANYYSKQVKKIQKGRTGV